MARPLAVPEGLVRSCSVGTTRMRQGVTGTLIPFGLACLQWNKETAAVADHWNLVVVKKVLAGSRPSRGDSPRGSHRARRMT